MAVAFFTTDEGCRSWKACKDFSKTKGKDRCNEIGAKGHMAASCPPRKEAHRRHARVEQVVVEEMGASHRAL